MTNEDILEQLDKFSENLFSTGNEFFSVKDNLHIRSKFDSIIPKYLKIAEEEFILSKILEEKKEKLKDKFTGLIEVGPFLIKEIIHINLSNSCPGKYIDNRLISKNPKYLPSEFPYDKLTYLTTLEFGYLGINFDSIENKQLGIYNVRDGKEYLVMYLELNKSISVKAFYNKEYSIDVLELLLKHLIEINDLKFIPDLNKTGCRYKFSDSDKLEEFINNLKISFGIVDNYTNITTPEIKDSNVEKAIESINKSAEEAEKYIEEHGNN